MGKCKHECKHEWLLVDKWDALTGGWRFCGTMPNDIAHTKTRVMPSGWDRLTCVACREWLSLGPSADDSPEVQVEIRAAELFAGGPTSERIDRIETPLEKLGRKGLETAMSIEPNPYFRPNRGMGRMLMRRYPVDVNSAEWRAGYLAAAIAAHEETP